MNWSTNKDERLQLEALWVTWGAGRLHQPLLKKLLKSSDHRIRAAAMNVLRFHFSSVPEAKKLLAAAAKDNHGRVRMTAAVTASYLPRKLGLETLESADDKNESAIYQQTYGYAREVLNRKAATSDMKDRKVAAPAHLSAEHSKLFVEGSEVYAREGHCITCHQGNGNGLPDSGFPPLAGAKWVTGDPDRLIKVTLKGLMGPMEVRGVNTPDRYP